jgi:methionine synthase II (cobalamin-independent)
MVPEEARGFFALIKAAAAGEDGGRFLKGQIAGPVTFAGIVKDPEGKPILYDRELTQAVCQGLARKAAWQAQKFRELGKHPVIFFDEPFLTGFGSAYLPISRDEVTEILTQTLEVTREAGPVTLGIHCCGNTDWSLLLDTPIDVLSFDSYGYFDSLRLYEKSLARFLDRDGVLAWGLVPTGDDLKAETTETLWTRFQEQVEQLAGDHRKRVSEILSRSILTPACGMGYLTPELARRAFKTLSELSREGRAWLVAL